MDAASRTSTGHSLASTLPRSVRRILIGIVLVISVFDTDGQEHVLLAAKRGRQPIQYAQELLHPLRRTFLDYLRPQVAVAQEVRWFAAAINSRKGLIMR